MYRARSKINIPASASMMSWWPRAILASEVLPDVTEQLLRTIGQTQGLHQSIVIGKNHCQALVVMRASTYSRSLSALA